MANFGWSYPPGCSGTPFDDEIFCEVCGQNEDQCICPGCDECGEVGDEHCYREHGMVMSEAQKESIRAAELLAKKYGEYL